MSTGSPHSARQAYDHADELVGIKVEKYKKHLRGLKDVPVERLFQILDEVRAELRREADIAESCSTSVGTAAVRYSTSRMGG